MFDTIYHKAASASEAASLLGSASDGKLMAGGQTLIPTMKQRLASPSDLVDLSGAADLKGVTIVGRKKLAGLMKAAGGETITIGAMTTHAEVAGNAELMAACPSICSLAAGIGDAAVRHRGTIGGSVANNDPAADYPSAMMALNATINTNKRKVAAGEFFTGLFSTALDDGEIIESVTFQAPEKGAYSKFPNPASRYAMVGVFAAKSIDGDVRVAVTGAGSDGVFRHAGLESALSSDWSEASAAGVSIAAGDLMADLHGSSEYRANLISVMAKRAAAAAS